MNKTIAITGANGHLGNVVCRILCEKGYRVKAFCHSSTESIQGLPLEIVQGDVLNKVDLERLIDGCEIVIHCAAIISIHGDPTGMVFKTNTEGPRNVLEISHLKGVKRIVHISSVHAVYEEPASVPFDEKRPYKTSSAFVYDYSKATGEQIMLDKSIIGKPEVVVLRPSCIVGPFDFKPSEMGKALMELFEGIIPALPEGGYDFVDVRDVANSVINAIDLGRDGEAYLLTGKYYSMKELSNLLNKISGKKTPRWILPFWLLKSLLPIISLSAKITKTAPLFTIESIQALKNGHPNMDNSKATKELGHTCRPLEASIRDFYNWQQSNK